MSGCDAALADLAAALKYGLTSVGISGVLQVCTVCAALLQHLNGISSNIIWCSLRLEVPSVRCSCSLTWRCWCMDQLFLLCIQLLQNI